MNKMNLVVTSLVAAVPGAFLLYLLLMAVLGSFDRMPMVLKITAIVALVMAGVVALFPLYLQIWYGGRTTARSAKKGGKEQSGRGRRCRGRYAGLSKRCGRGRRC